MIPIVRMKFALKYSCPLPISLIDCCGQFRCNYISAHEINIHVCKWYGNIVLVEYVTHAELYMKWFTSVILLLKWNLGPHETVNHVTACQYHHGAKQNNILIYTLIARFMGPTWGPSGAERTRVGPMLAPWTLLSGRVTYWYILI